MPLYEYQCKECDHKWVFLKKINERDDFVGLGCDQCMAEKSIIRIPTNGYFKVNGYNYHNGYSKPSPTRKN